MSLLAVFSASVCFTTGAVLGGKPDPSKTDLFQGVVGSTSIVMNGQTIQGQSKTLRVRIPFSICLL